MSEIPTPKIDFEPPKYVAIIKDIMKYNNPNLNPEDGFAIIKLCPFFSEDDMKDHIGESLECETCELIWWGKYDTFLELLIGDGGEYRLEGK